MKYPENICISCPDKGVYDFPCCARLRNLAEFRRFENKLARRIAKEYARADVNSWKFNLPAAKHITEVVTKFLREE
jgi:hypothetical protein